MEISLVMFTDKDERRDFPIKSKKTTIGRNTECSLQIPLAVISRRHCELRVKDDEVRVRDLGSSNGTYVNNKRVQEAEIHAGDTLTVGPVIFTVVIDGEPSEIKPIHSVVETHNKKKRPTPKPVPAAPKNPDDTGSIDLEDSVGPLELTLDEDEEEEGGNPLSALEELARQKKP